MQAAPLAAALMPGPRSRAQQACAPVLPYDLSSWVPVQERTRAGHSKPVHLSPPRIPRLMDSYAGADTGGAQQGCGPVPSPCPEAHGFPVPVQERTQAGHSESAGLALLWAHPRAALLPALAGFLACAALLLAARLAGAAEL